ncbi:MAG: hypothetical protein ACLSH6_08455 [Limosilactobacillus pontis]
MKGHMRKAHHLNHRQSLIYGATLLPVNTFFKLYLRDQERNAKSRRRLSKGKA